MMRVNRSSIHNLWFERASRLSLRGCIYDAVGCLPSPERADEKGCATRVYVYEEAAYHQGTGHAEARAESGMLEEKIESFESGVDGASKESGSGVVPLCNPTANMLQSPCARNASIFGKMWHWVKKNVKKILATAAAAVGTAVIAGVTLVATLSCGAAAGGDPFAEFDCYKIAAFGGSFRLAAGRVTVAAWEDK